MRGVSQLLESAIEDAGTHQAGLDSCTFCRRPRRQVILLIVCGEAAICNDCIVAAADAARDALRAKPRINGHAPPLAGHDPYTGEMCDQCFNFRMIRTGTCSTCQDCGSSSSACS